MYSDQITITVTATTKIPYSVAFSPSDGQLEPYQPIIMQYPCEVEIIQEYVGSMEYGRSYQLYQDADKTKVYIKQVPHIDYKDLFPEVEQLPWPTKSQRLNYSYDSFADYIKPVGGVWDYPVSPLSPYDFQSKEQLPLELLGVYPKNGGNYNLLITGNSGYTNSYYVTEDAYIKNLPVIFLFNQPVNRGDISQFTVNSVSSINNVSGHWSSFQTRAIQTYSGVIWSCPKLPIITYCMALV